MGKMQRVFHRAIGFGFRKFGGGIGNFKRRGGKVWIFILEVHCNIIGTLEGK